MNACVLYFSRTGNTHKFAEAIAKMLQIPVYDITSIDPSIVNNCDVAILGTQVNGFRPATETLE